MTQHGAQFDTESRQEIGKACSGKVRTLPRYVYEHQRVSGAYLYFVRGGFPQVRIKAAFGTKAFDAEYAEALATRGGVRRNKVRPPPAVKIVPVPDVFLTRDGECRFTAMERQARLRAGRRGRPYTLPVGWMKAQYEKQKGLCAVSGLRMIKDRDKHAPLAPSIDRIDSAGGYTKQNCRLVAYMVNCAMNQFTESEFLQMCRAVVARHE